MSVNKQYAVQGCFISESVAGGNQISSCQWKSNQSEAGFVVPGQCSVLSQTPLRVPKSTAAVATESSDGLSDVFTDARQKLDTIEQNLFGTMPGRFSLAAKTAGQRQKRSGEVSKSSLIGRTSLSVQTPQRVLKKKQNPVCSGRLSFSAHKPMKTIREDTIGDRIDFLQGDCKQHLFQETPQRIHRKENTENIQDIDEQGLGRTSQFAPVCNRPVAGRLSLTAQAPSRVLKNNINDIQMESVDGSQTVGRTSLSAQTPGRVPRKPSHIVSLQLFYSAHTRTYCWLFVVLASLWK